jgi:hypothetical protein
MCHVRVDSVDGDRGGEDGCPIPLLNPLTKLRNGSRSQSRAPDGGDTASVLARVRGLVSDSPSSDSRSRFLPAPARVEASTAVASVEATDNGGRFSDLSERLGLASEVFVGVSSVCIPVCSLCGELSYPQFKHNEGLLTGEAKRTDLGQFALCSSHLVGL